MGIRDRAHRAWNAFFNRDPTYEYNTEGESSYTRPDRIRLTRGNEKSIITSIFNRIALDVADIDIRHCQLDENERYLKDIKSGLNTCFTLEANKDQTGRMFIHDIVLSCLDEGHIAVVPVDTDKNPLKTNSYDIFSARTGKILQWKPDDVLVRLYNDQTGKMEERWFPKRIVLIMENPLYAVVNEQNSTAQRLKRKLSLLDYTDDQIASGKLNMLLSLPYSTKTTIKRKEAEKRIKSIEQQLVDSPRGIAYVDATEKVTQLNRPLENNLLAQVEFLTNQLFSQLGITQEVLNGTADEKTMLNYFNRSIKPFVAMIVDETKRKWLTKTARTQGQSVLAFRDPFSLVPVNDIAEIADKFTRNEIMTSNEVRQAIGMRPSSDPKADQLVNSNISQSSEEQAKWLDPNQAEGTPGEENLEGGNRQNGE